MSETNPYKTASLGFFKGLRSWQDFDDFWKKLESLNDGQWYIYDTNQLPPDTPAKKDEFLHFLHDSNNRLHLEHKEDYCGIVYIDDKEHPAFIKIYDPANLGVVCGFSDNPPLPGWILSRIKPCDLHEPEPAPFWKKYLHRFN